MINAIIFIISFSWWLYRTCHKQFGWLTYVLAFLWGAFITQTIIWLCGVPTVIDKIFG